METGVNNIVQKLFAANIVQKKLTIKRDLPEVEV